MMDSPNELLDSTEFLVYVGSGLIQIMKEVGLIEDKIIKLSSTKNLSLLKVSTEVLDLCGKILINKAISVPLNLLMIVEPKEYSSPYNLIDGGYLLNNEEIIHPLFTKNIHQSEQSSIIKNSVILKSINDIMKIPFKINNPLLEYILNNPGFLSLDITSPFADVKKRSKSQEKKYQEWKSEKLLNDFILNIAETYRDVSELYFPLMLDFRGRLYPRVTYLNYQGSDLAKALLLFSRPGTIKRLDKTAINYLKSYGADESPRPCILYTARIFL